MEEQFNRISVAEYIKRVNVSFGENSDIIHAMANNAPELASKIVEALFEMGVDLSESIQISLMSKEKLSKANNNDIKSTDPLMVNRDKQVISPEILGWSIVILATAWTQWLFTSKSNDQSMYQTDPKFDGDKGRQAPRINVKLALPYIRCSILDILDKGMYIGNSKNTDFEPNPKIEPLYLEFRTDCSQGS